jgi:hypothetical protein
MLDLKLVCSIDAVVGRSSVLFENRGTVHVEGEGCSLRAAHCRFEGGAVGGIGALQGAKVELVDCSLGLTATGHACSAVGPGSTTVLRGCRIEGSIGRAGGLTEAQFPLSAVEGGALALEACAVDVGGVLVAVGAYDPGEGLYGRASAVRLWS